MAFATKSLLMLMKKLKRFLQNKFEKEPLTEIFEKQYGYIKLENMKEF